MRQAIVVAPPGFEPPTEGSVFAAAEPVGPLCATLARGGWRLLLVRSTPDLAWSFEQAAGAIGADDEVTVFVAAWTALEGDRVTLQLADRANPGVPLSHLADSLRARTPAATLFVVEGCHDGDASDPVRSAEHVEAIVRSLEARARGVGVLAGVRARSRPTSSEWPFLRHVLAGLEDPAARNERGAAELSRLYDVLRARPDLEAEVQSFACVQGSVSFPLLEPPLISDVAPRPPAQEAAPEVVTETPAATAPAEGSSAASREGEGGAAAAPSPAERRPSMDALLSLCEGARRRGELVEALAGYEAALVVADPDDRPMKALLHARVGAILRAQGKPREAERSFEAALASDAHLAEAIDALVELATEAREARRVVDLRRKRLETETAADAQVAELLSIAQAHADTLQDPQAALQALDEARALPDKSLAALEKLRVAYGALGGWAGVVDVLTQMAALTPGAVERSALLFSAADLTLGRLRDEAAGLALLERALDDDPTNDEALHALAAARTERGEWAPLDRMYARRIERLAAMGEAERAWDTCRELGALRKDKLRDLAGAVEAFTGALRCRPDDVDSRLLLADVCAANGEDARAVAELERVTLTAPDRPAVYARLFALHRRAEQTDRAWLAGAALEELGCADMDQQLVVDQYRPDGPVRPERSLDDAAWDDFLRGPGADEAVTAILRVVGPAAVLARAEELRLARQLPTLDLARRQSPASTVTAVRSFYWAASVLGVEAPELYILDSVPGGVLSVPGAPLAIALGPEVLRGLTTKELAFLAARHLTYHRPEHRALLCFAALPEMTAVFLAAVKAALPDAPIPANVAEPVQRLRKGFARHLGEEDRARLTGAVERFQARGGRADLASWMRSVESSAQRAGLLLCGDLSVAMRRLRSEVAAPPAGELTYDEKRSDLLAFCASESLARARAWLGVDAHKAVSVPPAAGQLQAG